MSTNNSSTWIAELASTMSRPHLNTLLLNTIRDITRSFTLTERQKMHRIRSITEAYDAWQSQTRQNA
jgi:hypothetical protein